MNNLERVIKLAVEGGYHPRIADISTKEYIIQDKLFWHALDKVFDWSGACDCYPRPDGHMAHCSTRGAEAHAHRWLYAHWESPEAEDDFWNSLLTNQTNESIETE